MLKSMTAFHRLDVPAGWGSLSWELRSVNHRWLDVAIRLPEGMRALEPMVRERIGKHVTRGKLDVTLRVDRHQRTSDEVDWPTVERWLGLIQGVHTRAQAVGQPVAPCDPIALLGLPGALQASDVDLEAADALALSSFGDALDGLVDARMREGERIESMLRERLTALHVLATAVRQRLPEIREAQKARLQTRLSELAVQADPGRLEQELAMVALRMDVDEEFDRLESHLTELNAVLGRTDPVGRRLDFLVQELHREANTLGSKSVAIDTSNAAIEMKVLIEQIREQIQNVE